MKIFSLLLAAVICVGSALSKCMSTVMEMKLTPEYNGLSFIGFDPTITRMSGPGMGNKIVLKNYDYMPEVSYDGSKISITTGAPCDPSKPNGNGNVDEDVGEEESESGAVVIGGFLISLLSRSRTVAAFAITIASLSPAYANDVGLGMGRKLSCTESIDVEIYTDVDELIAMQFKSGPKYDVCGPEAFYYEHNGGVYDGYKGCVSEKYMIPGDQGGQGATDDMVYSKSPVNYVDGKLVDTGYDTSTRMYWIMWGDPLDKYELVRRTGLNPTVKFPFIRGPYPSYVHGTPANDSWGDDAASAKSMAFDLLVYIGAFEESERSTWTVSMTEGAEAGVVALWGGMALKIARETCNRDIYVLTETPSYGYSNGDAAKLANAHSSSFYESEECLCFTEGTCKEGNVKIISKGWLPNTPLPEALGGDNVTYVADSASSSSPWFETMVFPENPSGKIKVPQLPDPLRRVCDGVYVWPMYFGTRDYVIPIDERPDCSSWSFSITKAYSASVRAGYIMYKAEPEANTKAFVDSVKQHYSMSNGLFSQWSWQGQMQLWEMIMSKPLDDPTSWTGAYSKLMDDKWSMIEEGFADCPVVELSNAKAGAYAFFVYKKPYVGIQKSMLSSFFLEVLGVKSPTYYWGFRGAAPADYYGEGYSVYDFTRMQLYRDPTVYAEVARRAKIVCSDTSATIGDYISIDDWAAKGAPSRRLNEFGDLHDTHIHRKMLQETMPHLSDKQLDLLVKNEQSSHKAFVGTESCAPEYSTTCLFEMMGTEVSDVDM